MLPGNHESAEQVAGMCARYGLHNFHERHIQVGRLARRRTGLFQPHAVQHAGRVQRAADRRAAGSASPRSIRWCWCATRRHTAPRSTRSARACTRARARCASSSQSASRQYFFCGHIHEAEGVEIRIGRTRRAQCRQAGLFVRIGLNPMTLEELEREYQPLRDQALAVRRYL